MHTHKHELSQKLKYLLDVGNGGFEFDAVVEVSQQLFLHNKELVCQLPVSSSQVSVSSQAFVLLVLKRQTRMR